MPKSTGAEDLAPQLIECVQAHLDFKKIIADRSRGDEYVLAFLRTEETRDDRPWFLWLNAWLATDAHVKKVEESTEHLQGRYFQRGFHPGYGTEGRKRFYETIYGGPAEPLVLGWSADGKQIDPELSQEFERCYKLSRNATDRRVRWDSWEQAIDDVALLEKTLDESFELVIRSDFLKDYQVLRNRWLLIGVYGEWGKPTSGEPHVWAVDRESGKYKFDLFGVPDGKGFKYCEAQGYLLFPVPDEKGFSTSLGLGVPAGIQSSVENMEFQTSEGRLKPWSVREGRRYDSSASATVVFDQEVLRRYQSELGAEVSLDNIGQLHIKTKNIHLYRLTMLLGTEYVSLWLGDFVVGVPPSEWMHWHSFNISFIGYEKQRELFEANNLFRMTKQLIRHTKLINMRWLWLSEDDALPFNPNHHTDKDYHALTEALPRKADGYELIERARALDGLIAESVSLTHMRSFLKRVGFDSQALEKLGTIKLLSTFMMVVRLTEAAEGWHDDAEAALSYAHQRVSHWQNGRTDQLTTEETKLIEQTVKQFEAMFLIHSLRVVAAHPTAPELQAEISGVFKRHSGLAPDPARYRDAILDLYGALSDCLEGCRA